MADNDDNQDDLTQDDQNLDDRSQDQNDQQDDTQDQQPAPLTSEQIAAIVRDTVSAQLTARQDDVAPKPVDVDAEMARLTDLAATDFPAYTKEVLEMGRKQAEAAMEARYGSHLARSAERDVSETLSTGFGVKGKEYISQYAGMITPEQAKDPKVSDLIRRGARDFEREHTTVRQKVESTHGDPITLRPEDRKMADVFAQIGARASGVSLDKIKLSDDDLKSVRAELEEEEV